MIYIFPKRSQKNPENMHQIKPEIRYQIVQKFHLQKYGHAGIEGITGPQK